MLTVLAGSHFSCALVLEGSKRFWKVLVEAKYDRKSWQEVKMGGLVNITLATQRQPTGLTTTNTAEINWQK